MKQISREQSELIDAVIAELTTGGISPGVLEKDIHVTDALEALTALSHDHVRLAFCGGTSLSKAHRLIERMSEDVDLKVIINPSHGMSNSKLKSHLSELKAKVASTLEEIGLEERTDQRLALNENRYFASHWSYAPAYESDVSLRPYLSLELTVRIPQHGTVTKDIGYLVEQLAKQKKTNVSLDCVTVEETLSEKILSFLRRYSQHRAGLMRAQWDKALVRHVYDVYCISSLDPDALHRAHPQFKALVDYDVSEFGVQYEAFAKNPKQTLLDALAKTEGDSKLHEEYKTRLIPLVFGPVRPSYPEAHQVFSQCADALLQSL